MIHENFNDDFYSNQRDIHPPESQQNIPETLFYGCLDSDAEPMTQEQCERFAKILRDIPYMAVFHRMTDGIKTIPLWKVVLN